MKRYNIIEKREIVNKEDIRLGCTLQAEYRLFRGEFNTAQEAIEKLRSTEYFQKSNVNRNIFTELKFEVTEFFVEVQELGEDGYPIYSEENGKLINVTDATSKVLAVSDMPEETDKINWTDNPGGL